jgi:hypothetical protein
VVVAGAADADPTPPPSPGYQIITDSLQKAAGADDLAGRCICEEV